MFAEQAADFHVDAAAVRVQAVFVRDVIHHDLVGHGLIGARDVK